jgi:hypothetical protein
MALKLPSLASSARLALSRKKSSSLGMCADPAPVPAVSLESDQRSDQCYRTAAIMVIIDVPEALGPLPVA